MSNAMAGKRSRLPAEMIYAFADRAPVGYMADDKSPP